MKAKKILTVASACAMALMVMAPGVMAANGDSSENNVTVSYDFTAATEPVSPNYAVKIPTGVVFDAKNPGNYIKVDIEMVKSQGEDAIIGACDAEVKVKSTNGTKVQLADGSDAVDYVLKYGSNTVSGTEEIAIGTLKYVAPDNVNNKTKIEGTAKLDGVATKTGDHTDKLVYTITDKSTVNP